MTNHIGTHIIPSGKQFFGQMILYWDFLAKYMRHFDAGKMDGKGFNFKKKTFQT